jgi:hypothetical protein
MFQTKGWLLVGTILLAVALGSAHATPFDGVLVIAQAPQTDQEKEKEKKPSQRPSPPGQEQRRERQVQPPAGWRSLSFRSAREGKQGGIRSA